MVVIERLENKGIEKRVRCWGAEDRSTLSKAELPKTYQGSRAMSEAKLGWTLIFGSPKYPKGGEETRGVGLWITQRKGERARRGVSPGPCREKYETKFFLPKDEKSSCYKSLKNNKGEKDLSKARRAWLKRVCEKTMREYTTSSRKLYARIKIRTWERGG